MPKTLEERLHQVNENIAVQYQNIEKAKLKIKELKLQRCKIEKQIEKDKMLELTAFLKKEGITSVNDFVSLLAKETNSSDTEEETENT